MTEANEEEEDSLAGGGQPRHYRGRYNVDERTPSQDMVVPENLYVTNHNITAQSSQMNMFNEESRRNDDQIRRWADDQ